ncbi:MAG: hypothetical protein ACLQFR_15245 [Streptosporangiaceae bacterium]
MTRKPPLHAADDLLTPALERAIADIDPPATDDALVALARILAHSIDRMSNDERRAMLGQTAPQVLRVLNEVEERAAKRRKPAEGPPSKLQQLRAARAASDAQRRV